MVKFRLGIEPSYATYGSILQELLGGVFLVYLSGKLYKYELFSMIGKSTFFIYLVHMPIAGIINTRLTGGILDILKPIITLILMFICMKTLKAVLASLHQKSLCDVLGLS